jgi:hypothetical protein
MNMLARKPAFLESLDCYCRLEDFDKDQTDLDWIDTITDSGSVAVGDAANGIATLTPSDGTVADNDEAYIRSSAEIFKFLAGKPIMVEARLQFTEANTDDANVIFGLANAVAANHLQDNGAGPLASYSGAVFFKEDGQTLWSVEKSLAGVQSTAQLSAVNSINKQAYTAGGAAYQTLRIEVKPHGGGTMDVEFWIDGVLVYKIKDTSYTSATEMHVFAGVKNGDTNLETLNVDYIEAWQLR